jgi:A/G-specific adenine glycosylase
MPRMPRLRSPSDLAIPARRKRALSRRLLAWYARCRRDLPWRRSRDPYRVWVSEIMLQQTQVATVVPYFERFVARFPSVHALAAADEHEVLRWWEGLGYYRRARQMHLAARRIMTEHGGEFPRDLETIERLPGIGRYTAGAIASIAFDLPAPILEANTARLFSRLVGFPGDVGSTTGKQSLWSVAERILPLRDCGTFNQALMELGSLVCTPREPNCDACPLAGWCVAFARGWQQKIPHARPKPASQPVREAAVVLCRGGRVLLRRRSPHERWAGMWDFVRFPITGDLGATAGTDLLGQIHARVGLSVNRPRQFATLKHGVTRFRITLDCYLATARSSRATGPADAWQWVAPDDLPDFALSTTGRKIADLLPAALTARRAVTKRL